MANLDMVRDGHLGGYVRGGDPGTWCPSMWAWLVKQFDIRSVLDVGCGEGHSTKFFHDLGCEVLGLEGSRHAIDNCVLRAHVQQHDFCTGPFLTDRRFDLVWSCEFLEHVEERFVGNILRTFALARKMIFVTHAFPGQDDGHHHVNCRSSSYWINRIESVGFACNSRLSRQARTVTLGDYGGVNHFARSGLVFRRATGASDRPELQPHVVNAPPFVRGIRQTLHGMVKAFAIDTTFRWSTPFRAHQRRRRAAKYAARRQAVNMARGGM